jgi:hypothetical protein
LCLGEKVKSGTTINHCAPRCSNFYVTKSKG